MGGIWESQERRAKEELEFRTQNFPGEAGRRSGEWNSVKSQTVKTERLSLRLRARTLSGTGLAAVCFTFW